MLVQLSLQELTGSIFFNSIAAGFKVILHCNNGCLLQPSTYIYF